jgi:hypothetical protein
MLHDHLAREPDEAHALARAHVDVGPVREPSALRREVPPPRLEA